MIGFVLGMLTGLALVVIGIAIGFHSQGGA